MVSQNDVQINLFSDLYRKRRFCKNRCFSCGKLLFHVLRTYRRASRGKRKAQVNANRSFPAAINALCESSESTQKTDQNCPKTQPGPPQNLSKSRPGAFMRTMMHPRATQEHPKVPQRRPREAQRWPGAAQERPKHVQDTPKRRSNPSKIDPSERQGTSGMRPSPGRLFERTQNRFLAVFCIVRRIPTCVSYWFLPYKTRAGYFAHESRARIQKPRKIKPRTLQNPPLSHPAPSKIEF